VTAAPKRARISDTNHPHDLSEIARRLVALDTFLRCTVCGKRKDALTPKFVEQCLRKHWPICCGYEMTLTLS
jgi:hypothetical protein